MGHVHDRRPYERTGPSAVDLILRFIADGPVIWEGWRRTAMAPPGLRLLWGRAHGPGAARGVRGAWRGGRPSAVAEPDSRLTSGFEMECAWPAAVASQKTVGGFPRIAWRTAGHIARRVAARLESSMPCMFDGPTAIGVDETSCRKGGHTYITVVVDHKRRRVVWAHDGYGKEVPGLFFRQPTDEQRASIKAVTGDGAKWIDASVKERLPNAGRVPDSFHIVSRMSDAPDQVRKRVRNQARRGNDKTATEAMRGVRYAVPKNPEDLTERQDTDPRGQPYRSWQLKELLGTLPHQPTGQAGAKLKRWIFRASHSRIPEIVESFTVPALPEPFNYQNSNSTYE